MEKLIELFTKQCLASEVKVENWKLLKLKIDCDVFRNEFSFFELGFYCNIGIISLSSVSVSNRYYRCRNQLLEH